MRWNSLTALSVAGPKYPSMFSEESTLRNRDWIDFTSSPLSQRRIGYWSLARYDGHTGAAGRCWAAATFEPARPPTRSAAAMNEVVMRFMGSSDESDDSAG